MFFSHIKDNFRKRNMIHSIIFSVLSILFTLLFGWCLYLTLTDFDRIDDYFKVIIIFGFLLLVDLFFIKGSISSIKEFKKEEKYCNFIESAKRIGDISEVDTILSSIRPNIYCENGEMRYNEIVFFYMNGTDAFIFPTKDIISVDVDKFEQKNSETIYSIRITAESVTLKLGIKEENVYKLYDELLAYKNKASKL